MFFLEGDNESSYGGSVDEVKCDVDKWSYFEALRIVKELGYEESRTIIYKDPTISLFTLNDDKGAQDIVDLCKVHKNVHLYVQHPVSQPDYYDRPIEDETDNIAKVVVNVDETEDVIGKLVEDVINGKAYGVSDLNKAEAGGTNVDVNGVGHMSEGEVGVINVDVNGDENMSEGEVGDNNVDVNGVEDMSEGEVEGNNVDVNGAKDMSDNDDVSFQYDNALDVSFQDSDEDNDSLVEEDITHLLGYDKEAEANRSQTQGTQSQTQPTQSQTHEPLAQTQAHPKAKASGSRTPVKNLSIRMPIRNMGSLGPTTRLSASRNVTGPTTRLTSSQASKKK
ncbi:hypothetical protein KIW84_020845 [Lathyrus oleraceus]|uniref:PB1-like domain-containing protein n=1 Tax=Pisum sativum TaxID=3888 RepID=A0A9D5B971_PEA|nr:hypothetical protein KIW84_020845 [Pisum sativum]